MSPRTKTVRCRVCLEDVTLTIDEVCKDCIDRNRVRYALPRSAFHQTNDE